MSSINVDKGHIAFDEVMKSYKNLKLEDANEAETRLKVIDKILWDVLGWTDEDIRVEQSTSQDGKTVYADYIISTPAAKFIVEAKKAGVTFAISKNQKKGKLGAALSSGEVGIAIKQVRDYCHKFSLPFAIVTNGSAWIVFAANRTDGVKFEDTEAIIFRNFSDINTRFVEFWELLSRQRVMEGNLTTVLLTEKQADISRRVSSILDEPGFKVGRNSLYEHIEPAVIEALSDESLLNDVEALRACYVSTSERTKYDRRLKFHVADIKNSLGHKTIRIRSRKNKDALNKRIAESSNILQRLILILGSVGVGKTTFIHHTRKISAAENIDGKILWFYIDFKLATPLDEPRVFICTSLLKLIESDEEFSLGDWEHSIRPAYREKIQSLERGPLSLYKKSNPEKLDDEITKMIMRDYDAVDPYVEKVISNATRFRPGFLVIDNVDQIDSDERQTAIFLEAQALAKRIGLNVIMSIRDTTYLRHRNSPVFDAFQNDSLYIDPPSVNAVLAKRFGYAKSVLRGKSARLLTENGLTISVSDLSVFFDIVSNSFIASESAHLIEILSGGNIRRGLSYVREFLGSGHTSADKAIQTYMSNGSYTFPIHEIFKSLVLGQRKYYLEEESLVKNIFNSRLSSASLQLLKAQIINRFVILSSTFGFEGVAYETIEKELGVVGVCASDVNTIVSSLVEACAIRTIDGAKFTRSSVLLGTRLAAYFINTLAGDITYVEMCLLDSSISDPDTWDNIETMTRAIEACQEPFKRLELRIDRMRLFMTYLSRIEESWIVHCNRYDAGSTWGQSVISAKANKMLEESYPQALKSASLYYQ